MLGRFTQIIIISLTMIYSPLVVSATIPLAEFTKLDSLFESLSAEVYRNNVFRENSIQFSNIRTLYEVTQKLNNQGKHINAIKYIVDNKKLIQNNIDDNSVFFFVELLLTHNEWNTVFELFNYILQDGDKSLVSNIKFLFVKYYISRNEWNQTLNLLTDISDDLTVDEGHYALIINGVALQKQHKHRKALQYYRKIPKTSIFYNYAQLNIAIVFIKQGWWSDAHRTMKKLLKVESALVEQEEFVNRLYLVMGYSFLQQEYFRESRDSFRNIQVGSKYANRALLGIALSSASQGDNIGSLNILNILQDKNSLELAAEESFLLLPYVYEKIGQHKTASGSYTLALNYYEKRIIELNSILNSLNKNSIKDFKITDTTITVQKNTINFTDQYPAAFLKNLKELTVFQQNIPASSLSRKVDSVISKYNSLLLKATKEKLTNRRNYLQDYLNQSRFGIARLYDNSKSKKIKYE